MIMTDEKAIEILEEVKELDDSMFQFNPSYMEALDYVIQKMKYCEDTISRQSVLDFLNRGTWRTPEEVEAYNFVSALPSVNPMQSSDTISRQAAKKEQESVDKYVKSISKPTGVNFFDEFEDEQYEELDFVQEHNRIPCKIIIKKSKCL